ncbi:MAG: RNA 2',3'-cyclic phosphodiesterase, partial [Haloechinothrix sp.]
MRLFAAIVPPDDVLDDLDSELSRLGLHETDEYSGLRWTPRERRHLTVAFYGRDDPYSRAELLAERLSGQQGPRLSIEGAG